MRNFSKHMTPLYWTSLFRQKQHRENEY